MTDLYRGGRVRKDDLRVAAYGDVDELNSHLGLARTGAREKAEVAVVEPLETVQSRLFDLGADLATPVDATAEAVGRIGELEIAEAERWIDAASAAVPPLKAFILPGGSELAARLHVARTVCRRAERSCVALAAVEPIGPDVGVYLNRLSDLLFALARQANAVAGVADVAWVKATRR